MERSNILSTRASKHRKFKVHYAWIYVTERCNLHCDYCFFRHKHERDISLQAVEQLFLFFEKQEVVPLTLIFSGGEPFLAKENLFKILKEARRRFKDTSLHIQTNGLLIDHASIGQLCRLGVSLEFGIDGGCEPTIRHRRGLKPSSFKHLTDTIGTCLKAGISCGCTMTVHPHEAKKMAEGLNFIRTLGLPHVDVTPAAFMPWTPARIALFKKNYLSLARQASLRKLFYVRDDLEWMKPGEMDLSLHPPGYLLGGDAFLCLPENKRMTFSLWDPTRGQFKPEALSFYQDAYARMHQQNNRVPYREHVCRSFELVNTMMGKKYLNTGPINDIMRFLSRAHMALRAQTYCHDQAY
ncbi:MAG: radical SAM protein [Candidatus Omnitrophica bacterium]|nr:radical SAM protein [Candidatus Omnitrophota bacterium]